MGAYPETISANLCPSERDAMVTFAKRMGTAVLIACGLFVAVAAADAQTPYTPLPNNSIQQKIIRQFAFNTALLGRAYQQVPAWVYGYNPYPQAINFGPVS